MIGNSHKHQLADLALGQSTANQDLVSGEAFRPADKVQVERATSEAEDVVAASTGVKADNTPAPTGCFSQKLSVPGLADDRSAGFVPLQSLAQGSTINDGFPTTNDPRTTTIHVSDIFAHTELLAAPVGHCYAGLLIFDNSIAANTPGRNRTYDLDLSGDLL